MKNMYKLNFIFIFFISLIFVFFIFVFNLYNFMHLLLILIILILSLTLFFLKFKYLITILEKFNKFYLNILSFFIFLLFISYLYESFGLKNFIFFSFFNILLISFVLICKNLNVSNKFLCLIKNKNYFLYFKKLMLIKFFFLYVYVLSNYSLCQNTLTKYMHNHVDSDACIVAAGTLAFAGTVSFVSIKGYQHFKRQREESKEVILNKLAEINQKLTQNALDNEKFKVQLGEINTFLDFNNPISDLKAIKSNIHLIQVKLLCVNYDPISFQKHLYDEIQLLDKINDGNHSFITKLFKGVRDLVKSAIKYLVKQDKNVEIIRKDLNEVGSLVAKGRVEKIDITTFNDLGDFEVLNNNNIRTSYDLIKYAQDLERKLKSYEEKLDVNILNPFEQVEIININKELKNLIEEDTKIKNNILPLTTGPDESILNNPQFAIKPGTLSIEFDHIVSVISYILRRLEENSISYFVALNIIKHITQFETNPWYLDNKPCVEGFENIGSNNDAQKEFNKNCKDLHFIIKLFMDTYVR